MKEDKDVSPYITKFWLMTMGIPPESIDNLSMYEITIYTKLLPLYIEFENTRMENSIKKAISEMM